MIGRQIGRYQVEAKLNRGGMADIFLARTSSSLGFAKRTVLKSVRTEYSGNQLMRRMLINEARITASLNHANIVQVIDLVEDDETLYLVMEYLPGRTLHQVLRRAARLGRRIPPAVTCHIASEVLAGLAWAHAASDEQGLPLGIVHRDVSPANIVIGPTGSVKLIDFGIAKATELHADPLTRVGVLKGNYSYMSPEQVLQRDLDRRSDVFSCGTVLWESLVGRRLFYVRDELATLTAVLRHAVPPPSRWAPEVPADLDAICLKALSKDPAARHQTADEMRAELDRVAVAQSWAAGASTTQGEIERLFADDVLEAGPTVVAMRSDPTAITDVEEYADVTDDVVIIEAEPEPEPEPVPGVTARRPDLTERVIHLPVAEPQPISHRMATVALAATTTLLLGASLGLLIRHWLTHPSG